MTEESTLPPSTFDTGALIRIRGLAERLDGAHWTSAVGDDEYSGIISRHSDGTAVMRISAVGEATREATQDYITALSPAFVLELCAYVAELERRVAKALEREQTALKATDAVMGTLHALQASEHDARAQLARLKAEMYKGADAALRMHHVNEMLEAKEDLDRLAMDNKRLADLADERPMMDAVASRLGVAAEVYGSADDVYSEVCKAVDTLARRAVWREFFTPNHGKEECFYCGGDRAAYDFTHASDCPLNHLDEPSSGIYRRVVAAMEARDLLVKELTRVATRNAAMAPTPLDVAAMHDIVALAGNGEVLAPHLVESLEGYLERIRDASKVEASDL